MARTLRSATFAATPEQIWKVVGNPYRLPGWWPGVVRVESVQPDHFTQVLATKRGKPVRLDLLIVESIEQSRTSWSLQVIGSPFERLLNEWTTTIELGPADDGATNVTITESQQLKGSFRLGLPLQKRPAKARLNEALAGLRELVE